MVERPNSGNPTNLETPVDQQPVTKETLVDFIGELFLNAQTTVHLSGKPFVPENLLKRSERIRSYCETLLGNSRHALINWTVAPTLDWLTSRGFRPDTLRETQTLYGEVAAALEEPQLLIEFTKASTPKLELVPLWNERAVNVAEQRLYEIMRGRFVEPPVELEDTARLIVKLGKRSTLVPNLVGKTEEEILKFITNNLWSALTASNFYAVYSGRSGANCLSLRTKGGFVFRDIFLLPFELEQGELDDIREQFSIN